MTARAFDEPPDRRREERRAEGRLLELTVPEIRRMAITTLLVTIVVVLFLWMVREVLIAGLFGAILATYMRPLYDRLRRVMPGGVAATLVLLLVVIPVAAAAVYSYLEIVEVLKYISAHQRDVAERIDAAIHTLPFLQQANTRETVGRWVLNVSHYGASIAGSVQAATASLAVGATIFLLTAFYFFTDIDTVEAYLRSKVPPRYDALWMAFEHNVRGVLHGAIYATLLTQTIKSIVILVMNLVFGVPLAIVLALLSFVIGFFPIVGSWSVYVPVAAWLLVFRGNTVGAILMLLIGFLLNTVFISTYLRPKVAAERSHVLNFYWMFVALVTGVYTFGLAGIILGPILIGMLKAAVDAVTLPTTWESEDGAPGADVAVGPAPEGAG